MAKRKLAKKHVKTGRKVAKAGKRKTSRTATRKKKATPRKKVARKKAARRKKSTPTKKRARKRPRAAKKAAKRKTPRRTKSSAAAKRKSSSVGGTKKRVAGRARAARSSANRAANEPVPRSIARSTANQGPSAHPSMRPADQTPEVVADARQEQFEQEERPLPKTTLSDAELYEFRDLLLTKRTELTGDVARMTDEALRRNRQEASGDLSNMPIHMADIGSDNWEQEFTLGLIANERALVREIDEALKRIEDRTYGVCLGTHKPISLTRLRAKPWAKYCIEYARLREAGKAP